MEMKPTDILGNIKLYNADCMEVMKTFKDKQFDLAIIDPPYGLGKRTTDGGSKKNSQTKFMKDIRRSNWDDKTPDKSYFDELFRISKNQIIWGGNYFDLPPHRTFIVWDKMTYVPTMSQVELAWTSFDSPARLKQINSTQLDRFHPTQKPVKLYKWILQNYAKEGDTILDTHFGSLSIGIACHDMKFDLTAIELDKDYYEQAKQRLINHQRQLTIF
jgi:site-specific DNA-methyltransferase (adenine-specific)